MRILVTGGAGFIGSHLARRLLAAGHEVDVVDDLSTGSRENVPAGARLITLDLSRPDFTDSLPSGSFDAMCHLAAQSSGEISGEDPLHDFRTNAVSTLLLSRWCERKSISKFLYASSMSVYGDAAALPVGEDAPCAPLSQYGVSKLASEHMLRLASVRGLRTTAFRMFSVYGPGQNLANLKQGMVSIYLAYLLEGREVPVKGSLDRFRDFVHVDDVVDAWMAALAPATEPFRVFNLAGGRPTTVRELLKLLIAACGLPADFPVRELAGSPADQFGLYADISRARAGLGWAPRVELEPGLRAMAAWAANAGPKAAALRKT